MSESTSSPITKADKPPSRKALPPFEALRAFDAVARLGGVRKAAQWLDRDHAVISRHLRAIEAWTGVHLIERTPSGIVLTDEGRHYHEIVSRAMDCIATATLDLVNRGHHKRLQIWCISGFALYWLSGRIDSFEADNRGVDIELRPTDASPDFSAYEADVDIRFYANYEPAPELPSTLSSVIIARAAVIAVACPVYLDRSPPIASPRDLLGHHLLHESAFDTWANWLGSYGVDENVNLTGPRLWQGHLTLDAARHGRGIALANHLTAAEDLKAGRLIEVGLDNPLFSHRYGDYLLSARRDRWEDPILRRFRQWLSRTLALELPHLNPAVSADTAPQHAAAGSAQPISPTR